MTNPYASLADELANTNAADMATLLVAVKHRCGQLQLWKTMHAMEEPVTVIGYELAERLQKGRKDAGS